MDDSPSRAQPCGEGSRWKQAIIALPAGAGEDDKDRYSLKFFVQVRCIWGVQRRQRQQQRYQQQHSMWPDLC